MKNSIELIGGLILLLVIISIVYAIHWRYFRNRKLLPHRKKFYTTQIQSLNQASSSERIIAYDKILSHILSDIGYNGTVADKLKKKPRLLQTSLEDIWKLHKLRNRLVHEFTEIQEQELEKSAQLYKKILLSLCK